DKSYGSLAALRDVTLSVERGEMFALLGPNGAGKTTAIRLLLGLISPSAGTARVFGADPRDRATRTRFGAMLQVGQVPATLTVREHITLFSSYYPKPLPVAETLGLASLERVERRLFGELSGGQKQRLFFALAICGDPDIAFLDEPTVGLDVEARRSLWEQIRRFTARGRSVLLTTHYLGEADALADRIALISRGAVIAQGTPAEIKARAQTSDLEDAYLTLTRADARLEALS
ncbi:MAG: ABC transporter ATP-binding protein, partial [Candidatus Velthaea sp.]